MPNKSIYTSGITPLSVASLLSTFSNWGTCFWRLLEMISTESLISTYENDRRTKGVIFKVRYSKLNHSTFITPHRLATFSMKIHIFLN